MKSIVLALMLLALPAFAEEKHQLPPAAKVASYLQDISVTIRAGGSEGSGVSFSRDGQTYIWTAGHVIAGLRKTREVVDPASGTKRIVVEFTDPKIVKQLVEDGRTVGRIEMDAQVLRYSNADDGEDLALLRVRKKNFIESSAVFHLEKEPVAIGTRLFHVGSLLGQFGSNSMTDGIMSQHGRMIGNKEYEQVTANSFPGSSGGGVYTTDGKYIGMLVRGAGESFGLTVPIARMKAWAESSGVAWAIDSKIPMPKTQDLDKLPIEDVGAKFRSSATEPPPHDLPAGEPDFNVFIRALIGRTEPTDFKVFRK